MADGWVWFVEAGAPEPWRCKVDGLAQVLTTHPSRPRRWILAGVTWADAAWGELAHVIATGPWGSVSTRPTPASGLVVGAWLLVLPTGATGAVSLTFLDAERRLLTEARIHLERMLGPRPDAAPDGRDDRTSYAPIDPCAEN